MKKRGTFSYLPENTSRNFRSTAKLSIEINEITNDSPLTSSKAKNIVKKTTGLAENITATTRQQRSVSYELDKENRVAKDYEASSSSSIINNGSSSSSVVKQLKKYYDEFAVDRTNRTIVNGPQNATATGAIKKRKNSSALGDIENERKIVPKKRPSIRDNDAFVKSRFKVYTDEPTRNNGEESINANNDEKLAKKTDNIEKYRWNDEFARCTVSDARLDRIKLLELQEKFQARVTPIEIPPVPPTLKKVKVLYKDRLSTRSEIPLLSQAFLAHNSKYELPYDDCFIEYELEKEIAAAYHSRKLRRRNITIEQRKIIVKFLTRLNSHLFLPSFFLYQTVKLFDAVLAAKVVEVKDFQLVALAAMWIALKREHIVYNVPTAKKMLSFSKDLYEGKVELLLKCEIDILKTLRSNIVFPDPFSIMCYDITKSIRSQFMNSTEIQRAYCCGSYMIDLSLFDEDLMKISVVLLAAVVAETALHLTMEEINDTNEPLWFIWRAPHTSKSYTNEQIDEVRTMLIQKILQSQKRHSDVEIVFKKYLRSRYGRISHFLGYKLKSYLREE